MKALPLFTASLLLGCVSLASAQPAVQSSGQQVLRACAKTYKSLTEFKGGAAVVSQTSIDGGLVFDTADATFDFKRDQHFNISGHDTHHREYSIVSTPQNTTTKWPLRSKGQEQTEQSLPLAIAGFTGVANMAPTLIPSLLVDMHFRLPFNVDAEATLKPSEIFGGHTCFVVSQKIAKHSETDTYWIDAKTFLLRGIREEEGSYSFTIPAIAGQPGEPGVEHQAKVSFSSHLQVFSIEQTLPTEAELETAAKPISDKFNPNLFIAGNLEQSAYTDAPAPH